MPDKLPTARLQLLTLAILLLALGGRARADLLELMSGAKVQGEVVARDEASITVNTLIGGRTFTRKYPLDRVRAVTIDGKREVVQEAPGRDGSSPSVAKAAGSADSSSTAEPTANRQRTRAELDALIDKLGRTPPDWWDSVSVNYPKTLDLSWPMEPPPGKWDNQRNVGQYVWDVINRNPGKWREGVRFMHHMLTLHKDDPEKRLRAMRTLGGMYQNLLQDYPRAAFWWRSAGADQGEDSDGIRLAECYWRLGSKKMALDLLKKCPVRFETIKLLADMGETRRALELVDASTRSPSADVACLYAGDACRVAGDYTRALKYYQQVLSLPVTGQTADRIRRNQERASANIEGIRLFDTLDLCRVPDGVYKASSLGYEAQVYIEVAVKGGRIESVRVTDHREKQFYSTLTDTPAKIIAKQSVKGVDTTSRATITSEAIINATAKALAGGMR